MRSLRLGAVRYVRLADDFARADEERRTHIAESDQLNAQRNASSREIGALMKEGKKEEAEARRAEVGGLKERIG